MNLFCRRRKNNDKSVVMDCSTCYFLINPNTKNMKDENKQQYRIKLSEEIENGAYANAVSVHINNNECVIDFGYSLPNSPEHIIKVVSRINMSHQTTESFLKVLSNAILDFKNKNKA